MTINGIIVYALTTILFVVLSYDTIVPTLLTHLVCQAAKVARGYIITYTLGIILLIGWWISDEPDHNDIPLDRHGWGSKLFATIMERVHHVSALVWTKLEEQTQG